MKLIFQLQIELIKIFKSIDYSNYADIFKIPFEYDLQEETGALIMEEEVYDEWCIVFSYELVDSGMDNQETVNERGKDLYWLYDEMLWQAEHQND